MAPRSEFTDYSNIEFKPRFGTWASHDVWSHPKLLSSEDGSQQRRRRVRFGRPSAPVEIQIQEYMHVTEYTPEEKQACWYARAEFQAMRNQNADTMDKIANQIPLDSNAESFFGLETRVGPLNFRCQQLMRMAFWAVMEEQDEQLRFDGVLQDDIIAARYITHTWEASERALCIGRAQSIVS